MPSLRRTISSPSVRSSPYRDQSSAVNRPPGSRSNGHRRSSGSDTSTRRVLADIDWWSVTPGQTPDEETEDVNLADQNPDSPGLVLEGLLEIAGLFSDALAAEHIPLAVGAPDA
ncbi:hypothetical protein H0H81_002540, partial [Sphagnurus paluster]